MALVPFGFRCSVPLGECHLALGAVFRCSVPLVPLMPCALLHDRRKPLQPT